MHPALIAACCALAGVQPPLAQTWSDTSLIRADDDWSRVPAMVGYRGDGLVPAPGTDPRDVVADGSGTPVDVAANRRDPGAIGLAAGVAEFELPDPVVALRGSATARAPQLVIALDTRNRAGIAVRLRLRDIDDAADSVQQVAVQYRVGGTGDFANAPGGYVADATRSVQTDSYGTDSYGTGSYGTGSSRTGVVNASSGELSTLVRAVLPPAADNRQLVEVRVLTTDAAGRDEWVGVDDIEITASTVSAPRDCGDLAPRPWPSPQPPAGQTNPRLTGLTLSPDTFAAARRGPAIVRRGRVGAALRFRLSEPATVRFQVEPGGERLGFRARGRRGLNRMRFSGRIRGRRLADGAYALTAVATGRTAVQSPATTIRFRIQSPSD